MSDKNIQIRHKENGQWGNLFPYTLAENVFDKTGKPIHEALENTIAQEVTQLDNKIGGDLEKKKDLREMKVHIFDFNAKYSSKTILVQHNGTNIMIDFADATHGAEAINKVKALGVTKIDYAIVTHYHGDHYMGLQGFLNSTIDFSNTIFYLPPSPDWSKMTGGGGGSQPADWQASEQQAFGWLDSRGITRRFPTEGTTIPLNEHGHMKIYNTKPEFFEAYYADLTNDRTDNVGVDYNNFSLVTEIVNGDRSFLFTGDLALQGQEQLRGAFDNNIYFYDVEHHGLNHSYDEEYAKQITPEFAVIQNADEDYSYYSRGMYGYLKDQGTEIYITGKNGDITFTDTVEGTKVETTKASGAASFGRAHSYSLAGGHSVLKNRHLDDIMEAGTYVARTRSDLNTISGLPTDGNTTVNSGFKLVVDYFQENIRLRQTLLENSGRGYIWYRVYSTNNQWNPWFRVATTNDLSGSGDDGTGQHLDSGADLNKITTVGKYSAPTNGVAQSILNKPAAVTSGFTVEVYPMHAAVRFHQILRENSGQGDIYWRTNTGSWNQWWKVVKEAAD